MSVPLPVYATGVAEEMIANCSVLITKFSSTAYVGLALGKQVYSDFDIDDLRQKLPIQTGTAAEAIADVCRGLLNRTQGADEGGQATRMTIRPPRAARVRLVQATQCP